MSAESVRHLSESTTCDYVVHPLHSEPSAQLDGLHVAFARSRKGGEEEAHAECIVNVTEGVNEGGIPATQQSTINMTGQQNNTWRILAAAFHQSVPSV